MSFTTLLGWRSHMYWKKYNVTAWSNHAHKWSGRLYVVLILIEGALPNARLTLYYGIPALIMLLIYILVAVMYEIKTRRVQSSGDERQRRAGVELSSRSRK